MIFFRKKIQRVRKKLIIYNTVLDMYTSTKESQDIRDGRKMRLGIFDYICFFNPWNQSTRARIFRKVKIQPQKKLSSKFPYKKKIFSKFPFKIDIFQIFPLEITFSIFPLKKKNSP